MARTARDTSGKTDTIRQRTPRRRAERRPGAWITRDFGKDRYDVGSARGHFGKYRYVMAADGCRVTPLRWRTGTTFARGGRHSLWRVSFRHECPPLHRHGRLVAAPRRPAALSPTAARTSSATLACSAVPEINASYLPLRWPRFTPVRRHGPRELTARGQNSNSVTHDQRLTRLREKLSPRCLTSSRRSTRSLVLARAASTQPRVRCVARRRLLRRASRTPRRTGAARPRHASWFTTDAASLMVEYAVTRVAADRHAPEAAVPGDWRDLAFQAARIAAVVLVALRRRVAKCTRGSGDGGIAEWARRLVHLRQHGERCGAADRDRTARAARLRSLHCLTTPAAAPPSPCVRRPSSARCAAPPRQAGTPHRCARAARPQRSTRTVRARERARAIAT